MIDSVEIFPDQQLPIFANDEDSSSEKVLRRYYTLVQKTFLKRTLCENISNMCNAVVKFHSNRYRPRFLQTGVNTKSTIVFYLQDEGQYIADMPAGELTERL